jgi:hypothetical protein
MGPSRPLTPYGHRQRLTSCAPRPLPPPPSLAPTAQTSSPGQAGGGAFGYPALPGTQAAPGAGAPAAPAYMDYITGGQGGLYPAPTYDAAAAAAAGGAYPSVPAAAYGGGGAAAAAAGAAAWAGSAPGGPSQGRPLSQVAEGSEDDDWGRPSISTEWGGLGAAPGGLPGALPVGSGAYPGAPPSQPPLQPPSAGGNAPGGPADDPLAAAEAARARLERMNLVQKAAGALGGAAAAGVRHIVGGILSNIQRGGGGGGGAAAGGGGEDGGNGRGGSDAHILRPEGRAGGSASSGAPAAALPAGTRQYTYEQLFKATQVGAHGPGRGGAARRGRGRASEGAALAVPGWPGGALPLRRGPLWWPYPYHGAQPPPLLEGAPVRCRRDPSPGHRPPSRATAPPLAPSAPSRHPSLVAPRASTRPTSLARAGTAPCTAACWTACRSPSNASTPRRARCRWDGREAARAGGARRGRLAGSARSRSPSGGGLGQLCSLSPPRLFIPSQVVLITWSSAARRCLALYPPLPHTPEPLAPIPPRPQPPPPPPTPPQGEREFLQEAAILGRLHHPHIVLLIGVCPSCCMLVYELMDTGNLEEHLLTPRYGDLIWQVRRRGGACARASAGAARQPRLLGAPPR